MSPSYTTPLDSTPASRALGASAEVVTTVQYLLRHHGADVTVDGDFGPETEAAVRAFNEARGLVTALPGSGRVVTAATWEALVVTLGPGSQGEAVVAVQSLLAARGVDIVVDGDFGPQTTEAVRTYQQARFPYADGMVTTDTWAALLNGQ